MAQVQTKFIADGAVTSDKIDASVATSASVSAEATARANADALLIPLTQKGAANGVCPLDAGSKIDASYLPSYVDDVLEYANLAAFPVSGETGKIYVDLATGFIYRWSGSVYVNISVTPGTTDSLTEGTTNKYFTNARAIASVLTGYTSGAGTVSATDSILQAIQKLNGNIAALPSSTVAWKESITLSGSDITNQYVDLAFTIEAKSDILSVAGLIQYESEDYTLSTVASKTRVTFAGDLATGGPAALVAGDKIKVSYRK